MIGMKKGRGNRGGFQEGDYVTSKLHARPSPIWKIVSIFPGGMRDYMAELRLAHAQGWGPGPIQRRQIALKSLEPANAMLVIALEADGRG